MVLLIPQTAYAAGTGTLSVYDRQDGVQFRLYRVADEEDTMTDAFSGCRARIPLDGDSAAVWQEAAQTLEAYVEEHTIAWSQQGKTAGGVVQFEGLETGLYLVLGEGSIEDVQTDCPIPILVRVSGKAAAAYVKDEPDGPDDPAEPDTPDSPATPDKPDDPSEPTLPQTGQLNWPVPVMAALGLCLLLLGVALRSRRKGTSYEA